VKNWGNYYLIGVSAPFTLTKASKLVVGVAYTKGSGNYFKQGSLPKGENTPRSVAAWATISYVYTF